MSKLARTHDLELRYDGPIPRQLRDEPETSQRRLRGQAALLEAQALAFLDAAVRCETEIEDLTDDLANRDGTLWQRESWRRKLGATCIRLETHIACAAEAISQAGENRRTLGMSPHPLLRLGRLIAASDSLPAEVENYK